MQIVCPNCAASYQVSAAAIGAEGRSVRCVRCQSVWHQDPVEETPPPAPTFVEAPAQAATVSDPAVAAFSSELGPESGGPDAAEAVEAAPTPAAEPAAPAAAGPSLTDLIESGAPIGVSSEWMEPAAGRPLNEIAIPAGDAPPTVPQQPDNTPDASADIESIAARRRKRPVARRRIPVRAGRLPLVILLLIGVIAALIFWRGNVVRHAPQMASLYSAIGLPVNLRGLTFTDIKVSRDTHDGALVLVVEGVIVSAAARPVEVPRLRFAMRNEIGSEIYAWTAMPSREVLNPGETLPFRSRLAAPPGEGRDVTVRFFTRLDAIAGLR